MDKKYVIYEGRKCEVLGTAFINASFGIMKQYTIQDGDFIREGISEKEVIEV